MSIQRDESGLWLHEEYENEIHSYRVKQVLFEGHTSVAEVVIVDTPAYGRILTIDGYLQSSEGDEALYHESLIAPAFAMAKQPPKRVLILGGGEGATLREILRYPSVERCTMVDLDGELVALCRKHLPEWAAGAFDDPRAEVIVGDARAYLEAQVAHNPQFDLIVGDLPEATLGEPLQDLYSLEFYQLVRRCLAPEGIFVTQSADEFDSEQPVLQAAQILRTAEAAFEGCAYPYATLIPSFWSEWCFVIAGSSLRDPRSFRDEEIAARIAERRSKEHPLLTYDPDTHQHLFRLRRVLRAELAAARPILHDRSVE
jgi:spermidine synthase